VLTAVRHAVAPQRLALAAALGLGLGVSAHAGATETADASRIEALLINGGGTRAANYQSHLVHVRMLVDILRASGVPDRQITVLSGDGPDPAADVALREVQPEKDFWLLAGTRLEQRFRTPVTYESTRVAGPSLRAATRGELDRWFAGVGARLKPGDTLLLYVTDHGTKNAEDVRNNHITLWGKGTSMSVGELRARLAKLDPRVRTVMLMSQCYSGSFANAAWREGAALPAGNTCGYFSTTAERPAYGCYPEVRDLDGLGHSFDFLQELGQTGSFRTAQRRVLQRDATPDAPLSTSDFLIEETLRKRALAKGKSFEDVVDELLRQAWQRKGAWEPEIRLLDAVGQAFGMFSPRSIAEIQEQTTRLPEVGDQLDTHAKAWKAALGDANRANLDHFLAKQPAWAEPVSDRALRERGEAARELAGSFLFDLREYTRGDTAMDGRLSTLHDKADSARMLAYRMEVRLGVVLRLRSILATIAGREYLSHQGTPEERAAYQGLLDCESLSLPLSRPVPGMRPAPRSAFPPFEDDLVAAREVLPAWLGIRFAELPAPVRKAQQLTAGAAAVTVVYPESPAEEADLRVGDVILGPPEARFEDPRQIREWTMLATLDKPAPLAVLRGNDRLELTIVPKPYPMKWPELPGPARVSSPAPAVQRLQLTAYRGELPSDLRGGTPHLLFFWATWCGPCKAALAEVLAFERERGTPVLAITDEPAETLDGFFGSFGKPFPEHVAIDETRHSFLAYGVSGTPTFVLVDGEGVIRSSSVGYSPAKSLGIEGWTWSGKPADRTGGGR
jgi:thiol-disulfide isomerase/thioredoxin